ncbi:pyridoxamine 5'-phosphate oxidase family protein [Helicobacter sp. MIT 14-3879]|uniref:pyridoxamine 5'-phosphate oxidase family protein n=1 Tax=Helicobacter sp. MIT 14-3879 TaxID=2040649 RepID=UPI000E1F3D99|nr:pyridoxamine 5'-phosphate oxidase family protein [Helicobacter sp. MIT 14-3879]RDU61344.1 hypothetical protein CQA44_09250 [Helicobacter sp. MIT 14-3879]
MRRKDRELPEQEAIEIMQKAPYCVLSTAPLCVKDFTPKSQNPCLDEHIFSIPLSFAYHSERLFLHSAKSGRKMRFFKDETLVCAVFVGAVQVPDLFSKEEIRHLAHHQPKMLGSHIFTTEYESVIAYGRIYQLKEKEDINQAMLLLCQKYMPDKVEFAPISIETEIKHFNAYEVRIEQFSGKAKRL